MLLSAALLETFHVVPVAPTAMIFAARKDGIHHSGIKNVRRERLDAVAAVLVRSVPARVGSRLDRR
jgi:hypothetical protein